MFERLLLLLLLALALTSILFPFQGACRAEQLSPFDAPGAAAVDGRAAYLAARQQLISRDSASRFDAGMQLSPQELKVDGLLERLRHQETLQGIEDNCFPPRHVRCISLGGEG